MPSIRVKKEQLAALKADYAKIQKIDPASPTYKRILFLLDQLSQDELKLISGADIKWISPLAKNRLKKEGKEVSDKLPNLFETPLDMDERYLVTEAIDQNTTISTLYCNLWISILALIPPKLHKNIDVSKPSRKGISDIAMLDLKGYNQNDIEFKCTVSMTSVLKERNALMVIVMTEDERGNNSRTFEYNIYQIKPKDIVENISMYINQAAGYRPVS